MHNLRNYPCSVENCETLAYAKGFCNAHYLRNRKGKDMHVRVRRRETKEETGAGGRTCEITGCSRPHYGLNMCFGHYTKSRWQIRKRELVEACGNCCQDCGQSYPLEVYDFHHRDPKTKSITVGRSMNSISRAALYEEVKKCDLLCSNCHRIRHGKKQEMPAWTNSIGL